MEIIDGVYLDGGNQRLYVKILGNGNPPIVIEPAIGSISSEWYFVQKELAKHTTVITYDRAGYADSVSSKLPRRSDVIANELFNLLYNSTTEHPYIFVGHSEGAFYLLHFAKLFPHYVAGLVLLDPFTPNYLKLESEDFPNFLQIMSYRTKIQNLKSLLNIPDEQFQNIISPLVQQIYSGITEQLSVPAMTYFAEKKFYQTAIAEMEGLYDSINDFRSLNHFPQDIPIIIVMHDSKRMIELSKEIGFPEDEARRIEDFLYEEYQKLKELSPKTELISMENMDRNVFITNPSEIVNLCLKMLEFVKKN